MNHSVFGPCGLAPYKGNSDQLIKESEIKSDKKYLHYLNLKIRIYGLKGYLLWHVHVI